MELVFDLESSALQWMERRGVQDTRRPFHPLDVKLVAPARFHAQPANPGCMHRQVLLQTIACCPLLFLFSGKPN